MNREYQQSIDLLSLLSTETLEGVSKELDTLITLQEGDRRRDECLALLCSFLAKIVRKKGEG